MKEINTVLITGGAGYVGSTLVKKLSSYDYEIRVFDSSVFGNEGLFQLREKKNVKFIQGDIRNSNLLEKSLDDVNCVVHLAAITGPLCDQIPEATRQINVDATANLINLCKKKKVTRFFFSSTCSNYGSNLEVVDETTPLKPLSLYSETKIKGESLVLSSKNDNFEPCVLRFATVFGLSPKMRFDLLIQELIKNAFEHKTIEVYGPNYWRPFIHVGDVAEACMIGIRSDSKLISGEIYNVGDTNQNIKKIELAKFVQKRIAGTKIDIQEAKIDPRNYRVSFNKIKKNLGFKITKSIQDGIDEMINALSRGDVDYHETEFSHRVNLVKSIQVI